MVFRMVLIKLKLGGGFCLKLLKEMKSDHSSIGNWDVRE